MTAGAAAAVYVATLCPTIPPGDAGELIACTWSLGVPHPPGYPLYTVLGWLFAHVVPFGTPAWRLNLLSALCVAAAVGFVTLGARRLGAGRVAAAGAALAFAFAFEPWRAATGAEVFGLHATFVAALCWLALRWPTTGRPPYLEAAVLGLAGANHQTSALLLPALAGWVVAHRQALGPRPEKALAICGALAVAGLLPYLLLMWTGTREDALVWGQVTTLFDPTGRKYAADELGLREGLWAHVRRGAYGHQLGSEQGGGLGGAPHEQLVRGGVWLWHYVAGGLWLGALALAPLGAAALAGRRPGWWPLAAFGLLLLLSPWMPMELTLLLGCGLGVAAVVTARSDAHRTLAFLALAWAYFAVVFTVAGVNFPTADVLRRAVVARFYLAPAIPLALLAAVGLEAVTRWRGSQAGAAAAALAVCASIVPSTGWLGGPSAHWAGVRSVEAMGRHLLACVPPGGALFISGDTPTNACDALRRTDGLRPDVAIVSQQKLNYAWGARQVRRVGVEIPGDRYDGRYVNNLNMIDANLPRRPVCFFGFMKDDKAWETAYWGVPRALCTVPVRRGMPLDLDEIAAENRRLLDGFDWAAVTPLRHDPYFVDEVRNNHAGAFVSLGAFFHLGPNRDKSPPRRPDLALEFYKRGLAHFPDQPDLHLNLALLCLEDLGRPADAQAHARRCLELRPDDERAAGIRQQFGLGDGR